MRKLITFLTILFFLNVYPGYAQYSGGGYDGYDDDEHNANPIVPVCMAAYGGGSFDGYDDDGHNTAPLVFVPAAAYSGGSFDGYDDDGHNANPLVFVPVAAYCGGSFDGYDDDGHSAYPLVEIFDWGDAPDPFYPTLAANNGANHAIVPGFFLGLAIDAEPDGQPDGQASGDDNDILYPANGDDEDGVFFYPIIPGQVDSVDVIASAAGTLDAWIDFDGNGSWAGAGEYIIQNAGLSAGLNTIWFNVPAGAVSGRTYARFRFSLNGLASYEGPAPEGEVEDYEVHILSISNKTVTANWNIIGLPLAVGDAHYLSLFPSPPTIAGTLYEFVGSYQSTDSLKLGTGYWLRFTYADTVQIDGVAVDSIWIDVQTGWNIIAGPSCDLALADILDPGGIIIAGTLYRYAGVYQQVTIIEQGEGYWLRVTSDGQLCLPCIPAAAAMAGQEPLIPPENASQLIISDGRSREQTLYFMPDATNFESASHLWDQYSLPPLPPVGSFDIRFSGDSRLTTAAETAILVQGAVYPLTIRARNLPVEYGLGYAVEEMAGNRKISSFPLVEGSEIIIERSEATHLSLNRVALTPTVFAVDQNYPNPFTPFTTIRYAIPQAGQVEITVYNTVGQLIITLVDNEQDAGYYSLVWDGRNGQGKAVVSGTYFYRVNVGNKKLIRKMVLLK
ncbi:MAG: T9SS type A sorting domain-containing protein [Planctomycetes bacterium]|nr:T9SS type A sorting domain-containing protein [Planctomycetota bacterium]